MKKTNLDRIMDGALFLVLVIVGSGAIISHYGATLIREIGMVLIFIGVCMAGAGVLFNFGRVIYYNIRSSDRGK